MVNPKFPQVRHPNPIREDRRKSCAQQQHFDPAVNTPVPVDSEDDDFICDNLLCIDDEPCLFHDTTDLAWRLASTFGLEEAYPGEMAFVASAAKRQRSKVRLSTLNQAEKEQFQKAKGSEISQWIKTGTISKILRSQMPQEQILRCRWILTWKSIDDENKSTNSSKDVKKTKAKPRLVILG